MKRTRFDLKDFEAMTIAFSGKTYPIFNQQPLAEKRRLATLIHEYVFLLDGEHYIYLTVVGDEDQALENGWSRGWYVVEELTHEQAKESIDLLAPFTAMYR